MLDKQTRDSEEARIVLEEEEVLEITYSVHDGINGANY